MLLGIIYSIASKERRSEREKGQSLIGVRDGGHKGSRIYENGAVKRTEKDESE